MTLKNVKNKFIIYLILLIGLFFSSVSCKKFKGFSNDNLNFSLDTVVFDTVFTTIGSATKQFKIYNPSNKSVKIESIELMGGANSPFKINVDGLTGTSISDIVLEAKDSLFAFVMVTLKVNNAINPMVIEDSIRFRTNGKDHYIQLAVWGQDMYYHYTNFDKGIYDFNNNVTWPNDKPHLVYGAAIVDSAKSLTIQQDTKVYLHKNAYLFVYKGKLDIQGTKDHEVEFRGDRLESDFNELSGQYYGIYFHEAKTSTINYTNIYNGTAGVHVYSEESSNPGYTVTITNSKIYNHSSYGIWIYAGAKVKAENCLIAKNGVHAVFVLGGGKFNFNYCDILGYGTQANSTPAIAIRNYYVENKTTIIRYLQEGTLRNCVLFGNQVSEIAFDTLNPNNDPNLLSLDFKNCLIKRSSLGTDNFYNSGIIWNQDPQFVDVSLNNFHFYSGSPLNNSGIVNSVITDLDGNNRSVSSPDIGCYEY
jgi:hypothetical protein